MICLFAKKASCAPSWFLHDKTWLWPTHKYIHIIVCWTEVKKEFILRKQEAIIVLYHLIGAEIPSVRCCHLITVLPLLLLLVTEQKETLGTESVAPFYFIQKSSKNHYLNEC